MERGERRLSESTYQLTTLPSPLPILLWVRLVPVEVRPVPFLIPLPEPLAILLMVVRIPFLTPPVAVPV